MASQGLYADPNGSVPALTAARNQVASALARSTISAGYP